MWVNSSALTNWIDYNIRRGHVSIRLLQEWWVLRTGVAQGSEGEPGLTMFKRLLDLLLNNNYQRSTIIFI